MLYFISLFFGWQHRMEIWISLSILFNTPNIWIMSKSVRMEKDKLKDALSQYCEVNEVGGSK